MCTVSWVHQKDGYQLLCNRDEKRTRTAAAPPNAGRRDGVRYLAPTDGDRGGTWICVNEFGLAVCLVNGPALCGGLARYHSPAGQHRSRGLLLFDLIGAKSGLDVCHRIGCMRLTPYLPFTVAVLEPDRPATAIEWDGFERTVELDGDRFMPLVSSSFDSDGARLRRREDLHGRLRDGGKLDGTLLFQFHQSHGRQADAYSACMHRPDAETVSFSWLTVSPEEASFFYTPAAPCRWAPGMRAVLPRAQKP